MVEFNPPEGLLDLPFGDLKDEIDKTIQSVLSAIAFVEKFAFFLPAQYKTALDELVKLLTMLENFLSKTP